MVHPDFFGEDMGKNSYHSGSEKWWLQAVAIRMANHSLHPFPYRRPITITSIALHKKRSFPLRISSANVTKSAVSCGFDQIHWRDS